MTQHSARRPQTAVALMGLVVSTMLVVGFAPTASALGLDAATPDLMAVLKVSDATAHKILDALNSPWAWALSMLMVPLGFGGWMVTVRLVWASLVSRLGAKVAGGAMVAY